MREDPFSFYLVNAGLNSIAKRFNQQKTCMDGQVSVELLIIVGIGVGMISLYILYGYNALYSYKVNNDISLVKNSLEKIAKNAEFVALQGKPAKEKIEICFPLTLKNCSVNNKTLSCSLSNGKEIYQDSEVNLKGTLPGSGCWNLILKADENFVNITIS